MERLKDILRQIDSYLETKKSSEKYIFLLLPSVVMFFISYLYLLDPSLNSLKQSRGELKRLHSQNMELKSTLSSLKQSDIKNHLETNINSIEGDISSINERIGGIKANAIEIGLEQKEWSEVLEFLSSEAKKNRLDIEKITTNRDGNISDIEGFSASISGEAPFKNILNYIDGVENRYSYVTIRDGRVKFDSGVIDFDINVTTKRLQL